MIYKQFLNLYELKNAPLFLFRSYRTKKKACALRTDLLVLSYTVLIGSLTLARSD